MRDLDTLRTSPNQDVVYALYDTIENIKSRLDSDAYCEIMNALLVVRERLHLASFMEEFETEATSPEPSQVSLHVSSGPLLSEADREERIIHALRIKHGIENDMVELRRTFREGRSTLSRAHQGILKTIHRLERQRLLIEEHPIVL
jgi:hypothetical protein